LKRGQLEPVLVRKDGDRPALVAGFSRWRAIVAINKRKLTPEPLPITATYFRGNEREGFVANICENRYRNSTSALDDAHNCVRLMSWQMDEKQIAAIYFPGVDGKPDELKKAVAWVKRTVKLAQLTPEVEDAVKSGKVKRTAASQIAELAAEAQRELLAKDTITPADIRKAAGKPVKLGLSGVKVALHKAATERKIAGEDISVKVSDWILNLLERA
jgi:ParB-like chromosome segregation protein Spo0J